jgi:hypothetical protein
MLSHWFVFWAYSSTLKEEAIYFSETLTLSVLHGFIPHKTEFFIVAAASTADPDITSLLLFFA